MMEMLSFFHLFIAIKTQRFSDKGVVMCNYKIITDSTCDLPPHIIKELNIHVIPMEYIMDGVSQFHDIVDSEDKTRAFYNHLRSGKVSTTSMINSARFTDIFSSYLSQGMDVLYISFSSALSGCFNASRMAAEELREEYPERKIITLDSIAASIGQGLLVYHACKMKDKGYALDELAIWVEENKNSLCHWFTVEDLQHLKRGGRISSLSANVGTALQIKPILSVDFEGRLITQGKVMGRKKSLTELVGRMKSGAHLPEEQTVIIGHGDALDDALNLEKKVRQELNVQEVILTYIGPVIGSHTGPGMIGLAFMGSRDPKSS